ncbi:50S ribosomal protein L25 [Brevibacillus laterosporus]|uniref:Large ribosomal subunit protein bL25 n=1 Tax=Brevibacillus laterosporus TaxID=1465 RepID=A0A502H6L2_BRELA|nr:50S ribosomal protein L25 [Brevibacillus laterosporus]QDX91969.1 50S ribosomal protein L25 [Brevibacillus laterosporus]TPG70329.1 50S ribosomal protein L25 [Brevibacillus laterosporus]TPG84332.1 50S ribosomal protein L25 [Brevibacillus laterosporus]
MVAIKAEVRNTQDNMTAKAIRRAGWVPAVLYGTDVGNKEVKVLALELDQALREQNTNIPFTLQVEGKKYDVMVYELQRHPVQGRILHADFKQINMKEKIHTSVPVTMTGDPELGVATLVRHSVEISCLPTDIPATLSVDTDGLHIGDVILVEDLQIPPNVEVHLDGLEVVISVLAPKAKSDESIEAQQSAMEVAEQANAPIAEAKKV